MTWIPGKIHVTDPYKIYILFGPQKVQSSEFQRLHF